MNDSVEYEVEQELDSVADLGVVVVLTDVVVVPQVPVVLGVVVLPEVVVVPQVPVVDGVVVFTEVVEEVAGVVELVVVVVPHVPVDEVVVLTEEVVVEEEEP